ncbi:translation initiation factor IF-3, partial [uncultured Muribaculum sp.]
MDNKPGFQGPQRGNRPPFKGQQRDKDPYIINERIRAREVRLVGDNVENGIYSIHEALKLAEEQELDLIEISSTAQPPVCKILD